jgi:four helix bundle protein
MSSNNGWKPHAKRVQDTRIYQFAMDAAMEVFTTFKNFPQHEEQEGLTQDILRSSRTICAKLAAGYATRSHPYSCIEHLEVAEAQAAETLVFIDLAHRLGYLTIAQRKSLSQQYRQLLRRVTKLITRRTPEVDDDIDIDDMEIPF